MGLVLTVDENLALSFNGSVFMEFSNCRKKKSNLSVLDAAALEERSGFIAEDEEYTFDVNEEPVTLRLVTEKSTGRNKVKVNIDASRNVVIGRVEPKDIPDLQYQYVPLHKQHKNKKQQAVLMSAECPKEDKLKERYKDDLAWFYNL